jgi:hypothetical protein
MLYGPDTGEETPAILGKQKQFCSPNVPIGPPHGALVTDNVMYTAGYDKRSNTQLVVRIEV